MVDDGAMSFPPIDLIRSAPDNGCNSRNMDHNQSKTSSKKIKQTSISSCGSVTFLEVTRRLCAVRLVTGTQRDDHSSEIAGSSTLQQPESQKDCKEAKLSL
jgi:hypothetical protein